MVWLAAFLVVIYLSIKLFTLLQPFFSRVFSEFKETWREMHDESNLKCGENNKNRKQIEREILSNYENYNDFVQRYENFHELSTDGKEWVENLFEYSRNS